MLLMCGQPSVFHDSISYTSILAERIQSSSTDVSLRFVLWLDHCNNIFFCHVVRLLCLGINVLLIHLPSLGCQSDDFTFDFKTILYLNKWEKYHLLAVSLRSDKTFTFQDYFQSFKEWITLNDQTLQLHC